MIKHQKQDQCTVKERNGQLVFALNSEILLPENAPVRLTSAQLEELDYRKLYRAYSPKGRKSKVDPRVLFKVMVYGYQCGIYSSRKLEEACRYRIDFIWLLEDQPAPDHATLARFRTGRCAQAAEELLMGAGMGAWAKDGQKKCLAGKRVWAVCGLGNNGADGVAVARMLHLHGALVSVLLPGMDLKMSGEMEIQLDIAKKLEIPVYAMGDFIPGGCDLVIDAIFGIGLTRPVEGVYADMIDLIREQAEQSGAKVVSVDIPSGISSDTGARMGCAVQADVTVTFGEMKLGQALFPGREACGRLLISDIGFVPEDAIKCCGSTTANRCCFRMM